MLDFHGVGEAGVHAATCQPLVQRVVHDAAAMRNRTDGQGLVVV